MNFEPDASIDPLKPDVSKIPSIENDEPDTNPSVSYVAVYSDVVLSPEIWILPGIVTFADSNPSPDKSGMTSRQLPAFTFSKATFPP